LNWPQLAWIDLTRFPLGSFCVDEDNSMVICREGYANAEGVLQHVDDVGEPLGKVRIDSRHLAILVMQLCTQLKKAIPSPYGLFIL